MRLITWHALSISPCFAAMLSLLQSNTEMVKVRAAAGPLFTKDIVAEAEPRALLAGASCEASDHNGDGDGEETGPDAVGFEVGRCRLTV